MLDLGRTVAAVATPAGRGAIGALRLSGPDAHARALALFRPRREGARPVPGGRPVFGHLLGSDGRAIDHGFLVLFPATSSYTGEPSAELWTHGSPPVLRELLDAALRDGCAAAGPGEFSYRAVRHGRLDLARAEAVRDLIDARTTYQARVALAQAEGALSARIRPLRERLFDLIARAEASVEFAEESEVHLPPRQLDAGLGSLRAEVSALLDSYRAGRLVREGATVALTGLPNVGKSSLFNALLARERAIVSAVPGTTRDTLEESLDVDGIPARLVDTAGLREDADPVEREGVRRARAAVAGADVVIVVLDRTRPPAGIEWEAIARDGPTIVALNKADLPAAADEPRPDGICVSARTGAGLDDLRAALGSALAGSRPAEDALVTDARHAEAIRSTGVALEHAAAALEAGLSLEFAIEDLREAQARLAEVVGELSPDALYDRIFSTFCIGK
jgi:tRNA modification GTPase